MNPQKKQVNPFKLLDEGDAKAPERLKKQVTGSYDTMLSFFKTLELFVGNAAQTVVSLLKMYADAENPPGDNKKPRKPDEDNK